MEFDTIYESDIVAPLHEERCDSAEGTLHRTIFCGTVWAGRGYSSYAASSIVTQEKVYTTFTEVLRKGFVQKRLKYVNLEALMDGRDIVLQMSDEHRSREIEFMLVAGRGIARWTQRSVLLDENDTEDALAL